MCCVLYAGCRKRVVDKDVQASPAIRRTLNHLSNVVVLSNVRVVGYRRATFSLDLLNVFSREVIGNISDEDMCAVGGQPTGNGTTDARRATGDDCDTRLRCAHDA